jgi:quinoprotein glucose dehydrogenase
VAWPTQPAPTKPAPFARQRLTEQDLTDLSPEEHAAVLARFRTLRNDGLWTPPSRQGSIVFPGFDGGGEWGGAAVDRETSVLYVNASDVPWIAQLVPREGALATASSAPRSGATVYASACASCHGTNRQGDGSRTPPLVDVEKRLTAEQIRAVLDRGRGFMPSFATLSVAERDAVTALLLGRAMAPGEATQAASDTTAVSVRTPYRLRNYERWRDPSGYPAVKPPWGTLNAIDLNTGDYRWKIPLGDMPNAPHPDGQQTGTEQYGGPIVTAGGLVFIAATMDEKFRAFDKRTGALVWETTLPAAGYATPMTYMVDGRQYVVVAAGGGKLGTKSSDSYVAYALPR